MSNRSFTDFNDSPSKDVKNTSSIFKVHAEVHSDGVRNSFNLKIVTKESGLQPTTTTRHYSIFVTKILASVVKLAHKIFQLTNKKTLTGYKVSPQHSQTNN